MPLLVFLRQAYHTGLFTRPHHQADRVAHPRPCLRPRTHIAECGCRKLHVISTFTGTPGTLLSPPWQPKPASAPAVRCLSDRRQACTRGDVAVAIQPLELLVGEFDAVARVKVRRLPGGIGGCQKSAKAVGNGGRAIVRQNDRAAYVGGVVDDHQAELSAARWRRHASRKVSVQSLQPLLRTARYRLSDGFVGVLSLRAPSQNSKCPGILMPIYLTSSLT